MKKTWKTALIIVIILAVLSPIWYWAGSFFYCEILTARHSEEFAGFEGIERDGSIYEIIDVTVDTIKVLKYSDKSANVYYKGDEGGYEVHFVKQNDEWVFDTWVADYSNYGDLEDVIWPYHLY